MLPEAGQQVSHLPHQRALARSLVPQQAEDLALLDLQRDARVGRAGLAGIDFNQFLDVEDDYPNTFTR